MKSVDNKLRVFLCHAKEDKPTVRELYKQLNAEGWMDVWLDEMKLLPGQEWDIEIEKAVEQADVVIVCLSNKSVDKEGYVQKELRFVLNIADEKPEGTIFVIPLRLDDCQVPRRVRRWQYVDYFPENNQAWAYQRLIESLKMRAEKLGITIEASMRGKKSEEKERGQFEEDEENLTLKLKIIQEVSDTNWFSNPAGKQGYEIILLEKIGDSGTRYYTSLKPGETLRLSERLLTKYIALQVDMRNHILPILSSFKAKNQERVIVELNLNFRVYDARLVAMENIDPLGELRSKVLSSLNHELHAYPENYIDSSLIEKILQNTVYSPRLGLKIESVDVINIKTGIKYQSTNNVGEAETDISKYQADKENSLSVLNVFMHEYPDFAPQILSAFSYKDLKTLDAQMEIIKGQIKEYVEKQENRNESVDLDKITEILRGTLSK